MAAAHIDSTQCGAGRGGAEPSSAHVGLRAEVQRIRERRLTCAVLYIDVKSAYSSAWLPLAAGVDFSPQRVAQSLPLLGSTDYEIRSLLDLAASKEPWSSCSPHTQDIVIGALTQCSARDGASSEVITPTVGAQAGTPLSDVMFALV